MASVRLNLKPRLKLTPTFFMVDIMVTILDMLATTDIPMPIMASVRLNLKPRLKLTPTFFMVDMLATTDIRMPIMANVRLSLKPRLKLIPIFSTEDIMDTTWDMLDTMDMLDIPMCTMDKPYFTTVLT